MRMYRVCYEENGYGGTPIPDFTAAKQQVDQLRHLGFKAWIETTQTTWVKMAAEEEVEA